MERYDYVTAVKDSIVTWAKDNNVDIASMDADEIRGLRDVLWNEDSVTGNGSGSFTFSAWTAEEHLCHNLGLLKEVYDEFGVDLDISKPEECDVTIRCWLLDKCLCELGDEMERGRKNS